MGEKGDGIDLNTILHQLQDGQCRIKPPGKKGYGLNLPTIQSEPLEVWLIEALLGKDPATRSEQLASCASFARRDNTYRIPDRPD